MNARINKIHEMLDVFVNNVAIASYVEESLKDIGRVMLYSDISGKDGECADMVITQVGDNEINISVQFGKKN